MIKRLIPNTITTFNLICGVLSIFLSFTGDINWAVYFIFFAAVFDLLDGLAARILNAVSEFGKQLDSLADVVSFGVAPTCLVYQSYMFIESVQSHNWLMLFNIGDVNMLLIFFSLPPVVFGSLRLARFNSAQSNTKCFIGLPIPGAAILYAGLILLQPGYELYINDYQVFLLGWAMAVLGIGLLMVSKLNMISFKNFQFNQVQSLPIYILLLLSVLLIVLFGLKSVAYIVVCYILISAITIRNSVDINK